MEYCSNSAEETEALGAELAVRLRPGDVVAYTGDLGAGKTAFTRGIARDRRRRAWLLNHFLEQFKGTLYRQTMFAEFELRIGQLAAQGETLTADLLSREYRALNEDYFGPDMVIDDEIALEWARIPHFYYNYYVFQYATGYSAAIALSRRILKEGAPAVKDYLGFLSGGCSQDPIDLLRGAGVDMASPQPIQAALDLFGQLLDEMEELTCQD